MLVYIYCSKMLVELSNAQTCAEYVAHQATAKHLISPRSWDKYAFLILRSAVTGHSQIEADANLVSHQKLPASFLYLLEMLFPIFNQDQIERRHDIERQER